MATDVDRIRRVVGFSMLSMVIGGMLVGAVLLGRQVGDAIGTAYNTKNLNELQDELTPPQGPGNPGLPKPGALPAQPKVIAKAPVAAPAIAKGTAARKDALAKQTKKP